MEWPLMLDSEEFWLVTLAKRRERHFAKFDIETRKAVEAEAGIRLGRLNSYDLKIKMLGCAAPTSAGTPQR
jgi:hypothetical protein